MAEAVMTQLVREAGLEDRITIDSAGTHCPVPGEAPFHRTRDILREKGVPSFGHARRLTTDDLNSFDYILTMDSRNLDAIAQTYGTGSADVRLFLDFAYETGKIETNDVVDPYPDGDYEATYAAIRTGCEALLAHITRTMA